jgi:dTDP-4-dehydrorhamnose 3,5-epimerase
MKFTKTTFRGAWLIEAAPVRDTRGFFTRTFCAREYADQGLLAGFVQHSLSFSACRGTLRGMHFQHAPHHEVKVVSCIAGGIWDVIIDLRPDSPSFCQSYGVLLTAENLRRLYVPEGFAHGFQTLVPETAVSYLISAYYQPAAADGVRYDDPCFAIDWPLPVAAISEKDRGWPDFQAAGDRTVRLSPAPIDEPGDGCDLTRPPASPDPAPAGAVRIGAARRLYQR